MWSQLDIWNEMGLELNTRRTVVSTANQCPLRVGQRSRLLYSEVGERYDI